MLIYWTKLSLFYLTHCDIIITNSNRNWYFNACNIQKETDYSDISPNCLLGTTDGGGPTDWIYARFNICIRFLSQSIMFHCVKLLGLLKHINDMWWSRKKYDFPSEPGSYVYRSKGWVNGDHIIYVMASLLGSFLVEPWMKRRPCPNGREVSSCDLTVNFIVDSYNMAGPVSLICRELYLGQRCFTKCRLTFVVYTRLDKNTDVLYQHTVKSEHCYVNVLQKRPYTNGE